MKTIRHTRRTIKFAILFVVVGTILAFVIAAILPTDESKLKDFLQQAGITLVFGAILGTVAKLLLEDFDRGREQRAEQAQFLTNVLADLKAVYDRAEHARILLPAHRSATTYGNEMRDLISSRVQLKNVIRALDRSDAGISSQSQSSIRHNVVHMEQYLNSLTGEFREKYKPISDLQMAYEARVEATLKKAGTEAEPTGQDGFHNEAWEQLEQLPQLDNFLNGSHHESYPDYHSQFENALDKATRLLRAELRMIFAGNSTTAPGTDDDRMGQVSPESIQDH